VAQEEKTANPLKLNWAERWPSRPLAQRRLRKTNLFLVLIFSDLPILFQASNTRPKAEYEMLPGMMREAFFQSDFLLTFVPLKAISGCAEGIFKY